MPTARVSKDTLMTALIALKADYLRMSAHGAGNSTTGTEVLKRIEEAVNDIEQAVGIQNNEKRV